MRIYDVSQEGMLFLSPYVKVCILPNRLQMLQTLYSYETVLLCTEETAKQLCYFLTEGIREDKLYSILEEHMLSTESRKLVTLWLQMGVIE